MMGSDKKDTKENQVSPSEDEILRRMLNTPPKPHREMTRKGGETVEQDERPWDQGDPNCPSA